MYGFLKYLFHFFIPQKNPYLVNEIGSYINILNCQC